ncbi:hypothetical protein CRG98_038089 [Punica granatum]|uniref:Bifunctional inhibitor/plant lipid transfer protein/seed storage helical domain-containing protein n=1 Tax=Punica granatum TaxID=22663 RepID=A0A2I0IC47_PUNGR|nr:hypothetical protein CRG98_038089 [Punica granatum]
MAPKSLAAAALLIALNLLFFTMHHHPKQPPSQPTCPRDTLKLGFCADLLNSLVHLVVGTPPVTPCCSLIEGLADLEAAVCPCKAIKANALGINLNLPISLSLLLNTCGKNVPSGFQCA